MTALKKGGIYCHYKHPEKHYKVIGIGKNTEMLEEYVIYQPLYESDTEYWVRPKEMFLGEAEANGRKVPRFALVSEA